MAQDTIAAQKPFQETTQNGATANGNGRTLPIGGVGPLTVEIVNTGTGTCSVSLVGAFDNMGTGSLVPGGYAVGYHAPGGTRGTTAIAVGAASHQVVVIDDTFYHFLQTQISAVAGSVAVTIRVNGRPVT